MACLLHWPFAAFAPPPTVSPEFPSSLFNGDADHDGRVGGQAAKGTRQETDEHSHDMVRMHVTVS